MGFRIVCDNCNTEHTNNHTLPNIHYCGNCTEGLCEYCDQIGSEHGIFCNEECEDIFKFDNQEEEE